MQAPHKNSRFKTCAIDSVAWSLDGSFNKLQSLLPCDGGGGDRRWGLLRQVWWWRHLSSQTLLDHPDNKSITRKSTRYEWLLRCRGSGRYSDKYAWFASSPVTQLKLPGAPCSPGFRLYFCQQKLFTLQRYQHQVGHTRNVVRVTNEIPHQSESVVLSFGNHATPTKAGALPRTVFPLHWRSRCSCRHQVKQV